MSTWIRCMCCGKESPADWDWYICDSCGYRICPHCLGKHKGPYAAGYKCSQCRFGKMIKMY